MTTATIHSQSLRAQSLRAQSLRAQSLRAIRWRGRRETRQNMDRALASIAGRAFKQSLTLPYCIQAPRTSAGEHEVKEDETIERSEFAAVQYRIESFRGMHHEIGDRREA